MFSVHYSYFGGCSRVGRVRRDPMMPKISHGEVGKPEKIFPQLLSGDSVLLTQQLGHGQLATGEEKRARLAGRGWKTRVLGSSLAGISISGHTDTCFVFPCFSIRYHASRETSADQRLGKAGAVCGAVWLPIPDGLMKWLDISSPGISLMEWNSRSIYNP